MPVIISHKGNFEKTFRFLKEKRIRKLQKKLSKYGRMGVDALREATPKDTGITADSWSYEIYIGATSARLSWINTNQNKGLYIAVLIQYGHATRGGGYVQGIDYINPAMKPVFEKIANDAWMEVISDE